MDKVDKILSFYNLIFLPLVIDSMEEIFNFLFCKNGRLCIKNGINNNPQLSISLLHNHLFLYILLYYE